MDEAIPVLVDKIYTYKDDPALEINRENLRGLIPIMPDASSGFVNRANKVLKQLEP